MAELAELVVLFEISLILIVRVVFGPTTGDITRRELAFSVREETAREILGSQPTREASQICRKLLRDTYHQGVIINWEQARSEQMATQLRTSLVAAA